MKKVLLGIVFCLLGIFIAIVCGAVICNTIIDSDIYDSSLAAQAWIVIRVMLWSALAILDVFLVMVPSLRLIQGR